MKALILLVAVVLCLTGCATQSDTTARSPLLDENPTNLHTFDPNALRDQMRQATGASVHP
jgi:uncharacterized lipoprotein YajG